MKLQRFFGMMVLGTAGVFFIAPCSPSAPEAPSALAEESAAQDEAEHHMDGDEHDMEGMDHIHAEVPHEYAELTNPFNGDKQAVTAGKVIFETNCAACHGPEGHGDGPAAVELDPTPANLADAEMMGELSDAYLFWRVSEGGIIAPFNSAMPAWKESLSEEERWQAVNYLRTFAEDEHPAKAEHHEEVDDHHADDEHHEDSEQDEEDEHHEEDEPYNLGLSGISGVWGQVKDLPWRTLHKGSP